jgi:hypothetical protein
LDGSSPERGSAAERRSSTPRVRANGSIAARWLEASSLALGAVSVGLGATVVAWLTWKSLSWPLVHDVPLMHYVAWRIGDGAVPYRDLFDMNFPGVYLLHLLVVRTVGMGDLGWRAFDLLWLAAWALGAAAFVAPWGRLAAGGAAVLVALYHLSGGAWQAGQRDFLLCPLLVAGALGVARWLESRRPGALAWGGLAMGASITIKPHALALATALAVLIALAAWRAGAGVMVPLAVFAAATAAVPAAVVGWLALLGALPAWRAIVFDYLVPLYSRLGRTERWNVYRPHVWLPIGAAVVLSAGGALAARRFGARHAVASLGVVYGVAHFVGQGKGWEYHLYPLAAFAILLLGIEMGPALARPSRPLAVAFLLGLTLSGVLLAGKAMAVSPAGWERDKADRARRLAAELGPMLAPGETVQVFDTTAGGIHALLRLGVRQPTRFLYDFHFFHDTTEPAIQALRGELIRDLDAHPPALLVIFETGWPAGGYERVDTFPELAGRLARYDLVQAGPGYRIHAQRHH